jgi:hypothetical protein
MAVIALLVAIADDNVLDQGRVDARAGRQRDQGLGEQLLRMKSV